MHVVIAGGGIAGLAAAFRLQEAGIRYTLLDRNADLGGRCRTFEWHGQWLIRGAAAFVGAEDNLVAQAKALGIYAPARIRDMTAAHSFTIPKGETTHTLQQFAAKEVLASSLVPMREKLALGRLLPKLLSQMLRSNGHDPEAAVDLDTVSACAYFREHSPAFVDYILEPIMNMFCGYGEDDYSLAWLVWLMASRFAWANSWWTFAERGVGELTQALEAHLRARNPESVVANAHVTEVRRVGANRRVTFSTPQGQQQIDADAVIVAVPGSQVAPLLPELDAPRRAFFDQVRYVGHHIVYLLCEPTADTRETHMILPTVEGYRTLSNATVQPTADGRTWVYGEVKGAACAALRDASDDAIVEAALHDVRRMRPDLATRAVLDRYVQRNDVALCSRHVGHTRALAAFKALPATDNLAFAGDYLLNSTVGSSHHTGVVAADAIIAQLKRAR